MKRGVLVTVASVLGSFVVYGAHLACGGSVPGPRMVGPASAEPEKPVVSASTPATTPPPPVASAACGCATVKATASFAVTGDEKIVLDPLDATTDVEVTHGRGAGGKKVVVVSAVVKGYRLDVASERPSTIAIRAVFPEGSTQVASPKDLEAYVVAWGASTVAPRSYATVVKDGLTFRIGTDVVEIGGSLTLKDGPAKRTIALEKIAIRRVGPLPPRTGAFVAP